MHFYIREHNNFSVVPIQRFMGPNLTLPLKKSRSTQGHPLYNFCSARDTNATFHISRQSAECLWTERFLNVFTIYGHGSPLGHVTWTKYMKCLSSFAWRLLMKFRNILETFCPAVSEERSFDDVDRQLTSDLWPRTPNDLEL